MNINLALSYFIHPVGNFTYHTHRLPGLSDSDTPLLEDMLKIESDSE